MFLEQKVLWRGNNCIMLHCGEFYKYQISWRSLKLFSFEILLWFTTVIVTASPTVTTTTTTVPTSQPKSFRKRGSCDSLGTPLYIIIFLNPTNLNFWFFSWRSLKKKYGLCQLLFPTCPMVYWNIYRHWSHQLRWKNVGKQTNPMGQIWVNRPGTNPMGQIGQVRVSLA